MRIREIRLAWISFCLVSGIGWSGLADSRCPLQDGSGMREGISFTRLKRVLSGQYSRHSQVYYRWIVRQRERELTLEKDESSKRSLNEDWVAAQSRLGHFDLAIEAIRKNLKLSYHDNLMLGDLYMQVNKFAKALTHYGSAFEMNPNGVFQSEGYSLHLLGHVAEQRQRTRAKLPIMTREERVDGREGYSSYLRRVIKNSGGSWNRRQWRRSIQGLVDLILCGHYRTPIVLEALGDLLNDESAQVLAKSEQLAARAYLLASYFTESLWGRMEYRGLAKDLLKQPTKKGLRRFERGFARELAKGRKLMKQIRKDEKRWFQNKRNLDELFARRYLSADTTP